ncbi:MAG TPA: hypothetical protein VEK79_05615 [Thermoanaerobaculia bacterium]|nr:hypothetical protein [Thermoanaerobaculia bacterium]
MIRKILDEVIHVSDMNRSCRTTELLQEHQSAARGLGKAFLDRVRHGRTQTIEGLISLTAVVDFDDTSVEIDADGAVRIVEIPEPIGRLLERL